MTLVRRVIFLLSTVRRREHSDGAKSFFQLPDRQHYPIVKTPKDFIIYLKTFRYK